MKTYRPGAVGALMDEYERAVAELTRLVSDLSDAEFEVMRDEQAQDAACRSIQTIMRHVVSAGYGYSCYIREALSISAERPKIPALSRMDSLLGLEEMIAHTVATLEGRWRMSYEEMEAVRIQSPWGVAYDPNRCWSTPSSTSSATGARSNGSCRPDPPAKDSPPARIQVDR